MPHIRRPFAWQGIFAAYPLGVQMWTQS